MLILFDQATPVPIRPYLAGHTVRTAAQEGWDRLKNGDLLAAAEEAGFDILLTTDKNIRYQQNLSGRKIAMLRRAQRRRAHRLRRVGAPSGVSRPPHFGRPRCLAIALP